MPTLQQIEQFKIKARQKGFSEAQIAAEIARKTQEEAKMGVKTPATQTSQLQPSQLTQPQPQTQPGKGTLMQTMTGGKGITGLVDNVGKFLAPATKNIMQDTVASMVVGSKEYKQANEAIQSRQKQAQDLIKRANKSKDVELKKKYLDLARQLNNMDTSPDTNLFSEDVNKDAASRGLASGVEVGSLLMGPKGVGKKGVGRVVSATGQGALLSGARTATSTQEMTGEERLKATGKSALVGGVLTGGLQAGGEILRTIREGGSKLEAGGEKIREGVRQIKQPASVYGASKEKAINKTLNKLGFKGTADQQYAQLETGINKLESEVQDVIKNNPNVSVKIGDIKSSFMKSLKSSLRSKDLTAQQAKSEIEGYLKDLIKASGGKGGFSKLSLEKLRELKKLVNEDFGPVHKLMESNGSLSPRQKVIQAAWESLDEAVKGASPEMKELLIDESNLYRAAHSLSSARFNPPTLRAFGTSIPGGVTQTATDTLGRATSAVGKSLEKVPTVPGAVSNTAGKLVPAVADTVSRPSTEQVQDNYDYTQAEGGQDDTASEFQHENILTQPKHPIFGSMTKNQVLEDAFRKGANSKQLDEIESIYDRFAEESTEDKVELTDTAIAKITDTRSAVRDVTRLKETISGSNLTGPLTGLRAKNPYDTDSRELQAEIDRVRQKVGKALEGGVLRKEDEEKYKKILPTMADTKEVAIKKIEKLEQTLAQDLEDYIYIQTNYGKGRTGNSNQELSL